MAQNSPKSVHLTNYYHKNSGGISTSYNNLLAAAERWEREVRLIVPGEKEDVEVVNAFAKIYYVPAKYSPIFDKRYRVMMPWQYMVTDSPIRTILLDEMPDIVEVTDKYTLSMIGAMVRTNSFKRLGRPVLVHFSCERMDDNFASFISGGRIGRWFSRRVMSNYLLPSFDYHIANSEYTAEEFFAAGLRSESGRRSETLLNFCWRRLKAPRVPLQERVFVCPRGVNTETFSPAHRSDEVRQEMLARSGAGPDGVLLLYAGRLSPEKNVPLLADMMKQLVKTGERDFRLLVAGAGPLEDWLEKRVAADFPGRLTRLGHVDKETLAKFYANADVFVHPNPQEPFGIAPLEAMASGVPTVAPNSGGILSYATNENAWLVEPTGDAFAEAVREAVTDEGLRQQKVERALVTARENTRERATDRLFETYDKIYADFFERRDLITDTEAVKEFDYAKLLDDRSGSGKS